MPFISRNEVLKPMNVYQCGFFLQTCQGGRCLSTVDTGSGTDIGKSLSHKATLRNELDLIQRDTSFY